MYTRHADANEIFTNVRICVWTSAAKLWTSSGLSKQMQKWTTCKQQQNECCYTKGKCLLRGSLSSILMFPKCMLMPKDCTFIIPFLWALPSQSTGALRPPGTLPPRNQIQHSQIKHLHCLGPKCNKNSKSI